MNFYITACIYAATLVTNIARDEIHRCCEKNSCSVDFTEQTLREQSDEVFNTLFQECLTNWVKL